jgi:putative chitinase
MAPRLTEYVKHTDLSLPQHQAFWEEVQRKLPAGALDEGGDLRSLWVSAPRCKPRELVSTTQAKVVFLREPTSAQMADLNACLDRFQINTAPRIRHFLAQVGHESGGLRWMREIASGSSYEGRKDLGNTQPGDGVRFKGAGALQITGRFNYQRLADFLKDQQVMEGCTYVSVVYPFTSAGFWWHMNSMNVMVDQGASCRQISARVNGRDPANGLTDRQNYYARALEAIQ